MARRESTIRVYGPTKHGERYRLAIRSGGGQTYKSFETEHQALVYRRELLRQIAGEVPLCEAFERYRTGLEQKGNKPRSIMTTFFRLKRFFDGEDLLLSSLTAKWAAARYQALLGEQAVDTHRNTLAEVKTFGRWMVKQKLLKANPFLDIEGLGKRRHGKEQLRIDEARRWLDTALGLAVQEDGAIAAMATLLMGMRCGEVVSRVVRDLDDGGRLLWIPDAKTEAGKRTQEVPAVLQPLLLALGQGKMPLAPLFGHHDRAWPRLWVKRICRLAKVPLVTAHGMRGLFGTLGFETHQVPHAVAASLGHASASVTMRSYAKPEAVQGARQRQALAVLAGGVS